MSAAAAPPLTDPLGETENSVPAVVNELSPTAPSLDESIVVEEVSKSEKSTMSVDSEVAASTMEQAKETSEHSSQEVLELKSNPESSNPKSWVKVVTDVAEDKQPDFVVTEIDGKKKVSIPKELLSAKPLWDDFVIGKFPSSAPHAAKIYRVVNGIWRLGDKLKTSAVEVFVVDESTVKFKIKDAAVKKRALNKEMWTILGMPMTVRQWAPFEEEKQPALTSFPIWVHLRNVPPSLYTDPGFEFLAKGVGKLRRIHQSTLNCEDLEKAQLFVEADLTKELPKEYIFGGEEKGEVEYAVQYLYPWLPCRCNHCGKWGHTVANCKAKSRNRTERITGKKQLPSDGVENRKPESGTNVCPPAESTDSEMEVPANSQPPVEPLIPAPPENIGSIQEEGWNVPSKVCKSPAKSQLNYGEVSLLARTRFESLNGKGEQGEEIDESEEDLDEEIMADETPDKELANTTEGDTGNSQLATVSPTNNGLDRKKPEPSKTTQTEGVSTRLSLRKTARAPPKTGRTSSKNGTNSLDAHKKGCLPKTH